MRKGSRVEKCGFCGTKVVYVFEVSKKTGYGTCVGCGNKTSMTIDPYYPPIIKTTSLYNQG